MKREAGVSPARTRHRDSRFFYKFRSAGRPACRCTWDTQATRNWLYEDVVCCRTQQIGFFCAFLHCMDYKARASARAFFHLSSPAFVIIYFHGGLL